MRGFSRRDGVVLHVDKVSELPGEDVFSERTQQQRKSCRSPRILTCQQFRDSDRSIDARDAAVAMLLAWAVVVWV
jgi:hypothetical protein